MSVNLLNIYEYNNTISHKMVLDRFNFLNFFLKYQS